AAAPAGTTSGRPPGTGAPAGRGPGPATAADARRTAIDAASDRRAAGAAGRTRARRGRGPPQGRRQIAAGRALLQPVVVEEVGQRHDVDAFFAERGAFFGRGGAPDGAVVGVAGMDAAGFFGEARADVLGLADHFADLAQ